MLGGQVCHGVLLAGLDRHPLPIGLATPASEWAEGQQARENALIKTRAGVLMEAAASSKHASPVA